jgi:crotonobetainyl-CoA:carnitine CoA-transferase CaiB-like acyl-CoA transferase
MVERTEEGMLSPYRVLDLTNEIGILCGKLLGDLGADVIKVEKPGGDPVRNMGPFYHDEPDPEKSLFWFAFNTSKRGITLDIETADGQEIFQKLVKTADFVVESFPVGYMDKLGLGYPALEKINPRIIVVSVTPFGQTGLHKDYKDPGIVTWAMSGFMSGRGDADRAPVQISHHAQTFLHAAVEGAVGAMLALFDRWTTGEGQHVDVSVQESAGRGTPPFGWVMGRMRVPRGMGQPGTAGLRTRYLWQCKDGHILWFYATGQQGKRMSLPLVQWMEEEGMAGDFIKEIDWDTFDLTKVTQETVNRMIESTEGFFKAHTKAELFEGAVKRRILLYPVSTAKDIVESPQLAEREFWVEVEHPELGEFITYPGPFANVIGCPLTISRRAPLIGEHNEEIYEKELGISKKKLKALKLAKVI